MLGQKLKLIVMGFCFRHNEKRIGTKSKNRALLQSKNTLIVVNQLDRLPAHNYGVG